MNTEEYRGVNPRQNEYFEYLDQHIGGVRDSWKLFLSSVFAEYFPDYYSEAQRSIEFHDASKYDEDEFDAYLNYFYPSKGFAKDEETFDYAWLHHQKNNPHHWQYWVLIRDEGELVPMHMPLSEIACMCCDWHAFSRRDPNSTAYSWYQKNKDKMILSDSTRSYVEFLLKYLKDPLPQT